MWPLTALSAAETVLPQLTFEGAVSMIFAFPAKELS
jgi:hypothetical protein